MVTDPVCKVEVDEKTAVWSSTYRDKTYYFSSEQCKADFDKNPQSFSMISGKRIASRARSQMQSMLTQRKEKAVERIAVFSEALHSAAQRFREQNQTTSAHYADRAADNMERFSGYLRQKNADELISDTEDFVRRRPGLVIGGAIIAGFLAARFLKSSKSASV